MQDDMNKSAIDLDALVDSLIREKEISHPAETAVATAEVPAKEEKPAIPAVQEPALTPADLCRFAEEEEMPPYDEKKSRKKFGFGKKRREEAEEDDIWSDWGLKPIGHYRVEDDSTFSAVTAPEVPVTAPEVPVSAPEVPASAPEVPASSRTQSAVPSPSVEERDEFPAVIPAAREQAEPPVDLSATRIVSDGKVAPSAPVPEPEETAGTELPDQLTLEEIARVEDIDDSVSSPSVQEAEEQFHRVREEKIRGFVINGEMEELNDPEEEASPYPEDMPGIEDFDSYEETEAVATELQFRCRMAGASLVVSAVLTVILTVVTIATRMMGYSPLTDIGYLVIHGFSLLLLMVLNSVSLIRGLKGLLNFRANADTAPALTAVMGFVGVLVHVFKPDAPLPVWTPLAGLAMLLCSIGQYIVLSRMRHNFEFVSYEGEKYAAAVIQDEKAAQEINRRVSPDGIAQVAYFRPADFLKNFLDNSQQDDLGDDFARWLTPILSLLALAGSLLWLMLDPEHDIWLWKETFLGLLCISTTALSAAVQFPLRQCCRYMMGRGGFLVGWKAVRDFGNLDALVVDVADLYPDESILLHGIKTFSGAHIDDAILDAASVSIRSGGPLSLIFRRIIQNDTSLLHPVDSLVYEQGLGLSGWVDGRRILVGNRRLLQNHGVDTPSADYEARYAKNGRQTVYMSSNGELAAMFVVSYLPDAAVKATLQTLCRSHITLLVRSCDSLVTVSSMCRDFELDEYYVDILPVTAGRLYDELIRETAQPASAVMASNGHILGTTMALSVCRSLKTKAKLALAVQLIAAILGSFAGIVLAVFSHDLTDFSLPFTAYAVAVALLTWLLPKIKFLG